MLDESTEAIEQILDRLSGRAQRRVTLDGLVGDWKRFVNEVERGYSLTIYDYTNDLGTRRLLEEIVCGVPSQAAESIAARLAPVDDRFRTATRPSHTPIGGGTASSTEWWMFRIPWRLGDELRSDLGL